MYWTWSGAGGKAGAVTSGARASVTNSDRSHTRMPPLASPEKARRSSALHATLLTSLVWPSSTRRQRPVSTSHSRTVLSSEPERAWR